ncbi:MAG: ComEC/Rec2 family competence protein [Rickettsiaceae bacterium]|nr:ComEC/Rec2 family competence protein [Rickettsiaceae bacterium]
MFDYIYRKFEAEYHQLNLWYFVSFLLGVITYFSISYEPSARYVVAICGSSLATLYFKKFGFLGTFLSIIIISFCFGIGISKYRTLSIKAESINHSFTTTVEGRILAIKPSTTGWQIVLSDVFLPKKRRPLLANIRLNVKDDYFRDLMTGDRISVLTFLNPIPPSILPGGYDFALYNYFSSIGAAGYSLSKPEIVAKSQRSNLSQKIQTLRHKIYDRLISVMGNDAGNFSAAIMIGESKGLARKIMQNIRYAGISHILCVSGLHLSLVASLLFISSRFLLNLSNFMAFRTDIKMISAIISLIGSFLYLMLSGMQIAATRAFIMTSIFILSVIIGRTPYPLRSIAIAAAIIISINPEYVMHPSFQLSFVAVLSLITGFEIYMKNKHVLGDSKGIIASIKIYFFANIYSSLLASLATTPIVIYHFYISSNYAVLSNLLAVPVMSFFIMPISIISLILMPFGLDYYPLKLLEYIISIIINFGEFVADLPGAIWYFGYITPLSLLIYMIGLFWLTLWQKKWRHLGWILITCSVVMMFKSPKPDVIFDHHNNILGIKNKDEKLEIYGKRVSKFTQHYWSNWFGQKDVILTQEDISLSNKEIKTDSGKTIGILFEKLNCKSDIVINTTGYKRCNNYSLNKQDIKDNGTMLIFCNKNECLLQKANSDRFKF